MSGVLQRLMSLYRAQAFIEAVARAGKVEDEWDQVLKDLAEVISEHEARVLLEPIDAA